MPTDQYQFLNDMRYDFEWDAKKAQSNIRKHKVSLDQATSIFRDPNLLSIPDESHSDSEERWVTMGLGDKGFLLVISHTFVSQRTDSARIRIISARKATKEEIKQYEEGI